MGLGRYRGAPFHVYCKWEALQLTGSTKVRKELKTRAPNSSTGPLAAFGAFIWWLSGWITSWRMRVKVYYPQLRARHPLNGTASPQDRVALQMLADGYASGPREPLGDGGWLMCSDNGVGAVLSPLRVRQL